jgi:hypothetical protein
MGAAAVTDKGQLTRERRLRRVAARQGLRLEKTRRRDHRALDYQHWWVLRGDTAVYGGEWGVTLNDVERYLNGETR